VAGYCSVPPSWCQISASRSVPEEITISEPDSVALYFLEFDRLRSAANFGSRALLDLVAEDMR
jgi:hypothetical protein